METRCWIEIARGVNALTFGHHGDDPRECPCEACKETLIDYFADMEIDER